MEKNKKFIFLLLVFSILLMGCEALATPPSTTTTGNPLAGDESLDVLKERTAVPTKTPDLKLPPTMVPTITLQPTQLITEEYFPTQKTETPTPLAATWRSAESSDCLWLNPDLPALFLESFKQKNGSYCAGKLMPEMAYAEYGSENTVSEWVFALVAPFPSLIDTITWDDFEKWWKEGKPAPFDTLVMEWRSYYAMASILGEPQNTVTPLPGNEIMDAAWGRKGTWAIVPFEKLEPRWKVVAFSGNSPIQKQFNKSKYPLIVPISVISRDNSNFDALKQRFSPSIMSTNRISADIATVMVTGVTALVRSTAVEMEVKGLTAPAEELGAAMREADLLHISNEVPFHPGCPYPTGASGVRLIFCSADKYMELLEFIGTDVVELTGDHMLDWGPYGMDHTLEMYKEHNLPYYGGGANTEDAGQPATFEINHNKIAFIGCNAKPFSYVNAGENSPGAWDCNMEEISEKITALKADGFNVIATFQHLEVYQWEPTPRMQDDFRRVADAGAVIVSGSQAHHPHSMEFYGPNNSEIRYGLGNTFFDQYGLSPYTDTAFIDVHVFYQNRHISTELISVQFFDYSTPRYMTPEARDSLLRMLFGTSGWTIY